MAVEEEVLAADDAGHRAPRRPVLVRRPRHQLEEVDALRLGGSHLDPDQNQPAARQTHEVKAADELLVAVVVVIALIVVVIVLGT